MLKDELIALLQRIPGNPPVLLQVDPEGNGYYGVENAVLGAFVDPEAYSPDPYWVGAPDPEGNDDGVEANAVVIVP